MAMGRSAGDGKTNIVEEGAIGDESIGGSVSVRGRRVQTCNGRGGVVGGTDEVSGTG